MTNPWPELEGSAQPVDSYVGPFPQSAFLQAWWRNLGAGDPMVAGDASSFIPLVVEGGEVTFAGRGDVTDYHSVRGDDFDRIAQSLIELRHANKSVVLDSLPQSSAEGLTDAIRRLGAVVGCVPEDPGTAVMEVESDYLDGLSGKQRHELRRKHRRFVEAAVDSELVVSTGSDPLARFVGLHRMSDGDKGDFLDTHREKFFADLSNSPGWEFAELRTEDEVAATFFGYRGSDAYYLYNSAFNPKFREVSPGIVGLYLLIEHLVLSGCHRIDLLKGDETYKFRMGAVARPLFTVRIN
ncbi:MAG TPA: GNAT family N-acetyltransferase [Acidimicrobiia bacterium]